MGNQQDVAEQDVTEEKKLQKSQMHSKASSSFGDPFATFNTNLQQWANEDKIPGLDANKIYQIYLWKNGTYGHYSIVIGCKSRNDVGFVTMELRVNVTTQKIYPLSTFIPRDQGLKYIEDKKWEQPDDNSLLIRFQKILDKKNANWNWEINTTMRKLMKLTTDLINNHGKYSEITNSCQDFAINFIKKCGGKYSNITHGGQSGTIGVSVLSGAAVGVICGASIGGPAGVVPGAYYGSQIGVLGGMSSFSVAKSLHNNQVNKVKLDNDT